MINAILSIYINYKLDKNSTDDRKIKTKYL